MQKFTTDLKDANKCQWSSHPQMEYSTSVSLPHQGSGTLKREQTDRKSHRPERIRVKQYLPDTPRPQSMHELTQAAVLACRSPSEEQASQYSSMDAGGAPEPKSLTEALYTADGFWGQGVNFL